MEQGRNSGQVIYEDGLIRLTSDEIVLKRYYFPVRADWASRRVDLQSIEAVYELPAGLSGGSWRIWGTGDFLTWFPFDGKRPRRGKIFILCERNRKRRVGFTVEDEQAFTQALQGRIRVEASIPAAVSAEGSKRFIGIMSILFIVLGLLLIGLSIPLVTQLVPPNDAYGLRTEKTLSDEDVWYAANWFAGLVTIPVGVLVVAAGGVFYRMRSEWPAWSVILGFFFVPILILILTGVALAYAANL